MRLGRAHRADARGDGRVLAVRLGGPHALGRAPDQRPRAWPIHARRRSAIARRSIGRGRVPVHRGLPAARGVALSRNQTDRRQGRARYRRHEHEAPGAARILQGRPVRRVHVVFERRKRLSQAQLRDPIMTSARLLKVLLMVACVTVTACAQSVTYGVKPQTDRLSMLVRGKSTAADVLLALGEPRGRGAARLADEPNSTRRDVLFYEFVQSNGSTVNLKMLVVFMRDGTYDGHFWFSSVDSMKTTKGVVFVE